MVVKKVFITILGATNEMFSIFVPISLALLLTQYISGFSEIALIVIAVLSTMYRAIDVGYLRD